MKIEFKPVKKEEIGKRGKYREEVRQCVSNFLKLMEQGNTQVGSNDFPDRNLAMSYYDSFKEYMKKEKLPIEVKIRKNDNGTWRLFLVKKGS